MAIASIFDPVRVWILFCDTTGCESRLESQDRIVKLIDKAEAAGWTKNDIGWKCPECTEKEEAA